MAVRLTNNTVAEEHAEGVRLEGWPQTPSLLPPFETVARKRAQPRDEVPGGDGVFVVRPYRYRPSKCQLARRVT
jgi:hypothetical protein